MARWPNGGACARHADDLQVWASVGVSLSEMARRIGANKRHVRQFLAQRGIVRVVLPQTGSNNPKWRGGRRIDQDGYVLVLAPDHPHCDRHGYVREHRLVAEQHLGRYLTPREVVHHLDKDKQHNDWANLRVYGSNGEHLASELAGQCPKWTPEGKVRLRAAFDRGLGARNRSNHRASVAGGGQ